jgi:hypothetical protein
MAISGKCKKVTTSRGRVFYMVNPRMGSSSFCSNYGYSNSLLFDCFDNPGAPSNPTDDPRGVCFYNDESIINIESADDGNCGRCITNVGKYDCLNGNCVKSNVYGTPGQYATLTECQGNCGSSNNSCNPPFQCIDPTNFCPPGKVCVPQDEWSQIGSLVQQNVRKHCG